MLSVNLRQRGKTYQIDYRNPNGRRRRLSVGSSHRHAQRIVVRITDWLLDGKDPEREMERAARTEQARAVTVRAFFPTFMDRHGSRQSLRTQCTYRERFQQFCRYPGIVDTPIGNINKVFDRAVIKAGQEVDGYKAKVSRSAACHSLLVKSKGCFLRHYPGAA
jgi:hypothetical protein